MLTEMKKLLALSFTCLLSLTATAAEKPNIIVIMADDLGYGDLSSYGATAFQTPNIDRLAAEGQRFTSGYSSASTCTPSRFSLLTGIYAFRQRGTGIAPPNGPLIIDPKTFTLPDLMKQAGYRTAVIGKWHLGLGHPKPDWNADLKPGPLEIGFDQAFLLPTTNDRVPQVYVKDHRVLNLDPAESDVRAAAPEEAAERLAAALGVDVRVLAGADERGLARTLRTGRAGLELWNVFLLLALGLLVAEMLVARHWTPEEA
jgi:arylsulfatase A-like enzyme